MEDDLTAVHGQSRVEQQLAEIQQQLSLVTAELTEMRRRRLELEELQQDLSTIANDMFNTAVVELEDIAPFVTTRDFVHLIKVLLRNTASITNAVSKLESALDLAQDAGPLAKELFQDVLARLDELDQKGYFELGRAAGESLDAVAAELTPDDVRNIAENVWIPLIQLSRRLAQAKTLPALNRAVDTALSAEPQDRQKSLWQVFQLLRSREMRPVLGFLALVMQGYSEQINEMEKDS